MTRILIADDHEVVREGLGKILVANRDWVICGEAMNGREAVAKTLQLQPHVLVLDFALPDLNGLEVTRQVRATQSQTEVLILTLHESDELALATLAAGARGLVFKSDAGTTLVAAVRQVLLHRPYCTVKVSPRIRENFLHPARFPALPAAVSVLTPREREIIQLIAEGHGAKEVAARLQISFRTVDTHRHNIKRKLKIQSVGGLVRYALREKMAAV